MKNNNKAFKTISAPKPSKKGIIHLLRNNFGLLISVLIVLVICISAYVETVWINNSAKQLLSQIKITKQCIEQENWNDAVQNFTDLDKNWRKKKDGWLLILSHTKMDFIDEAIKRGLEMTKNSAKSDSLAELNVIHHLIIEIGEEQIPTFKNIL